MRKILFPFLFSLTLSILCLIAPSYVEAFGRDHEVTLGGPCTNPAECIVGATCSADDICVATDPNNPPNLCLDGILDHDETDVDCGGSCSGCLKEGSKCVFDKDCLLDDSRCVNNRCTTIDKSSKGNCTAGANPTDVEQFKSQGVDFKTLSCQKVDPKTADNNFACIVSTDCQQGFRCCMPGGGGAAGGADKAASGGGKPSAGSISLPACKVDGNCTLDDIIRTGVNFANFLFGLSGAIFLGIFVYAGLLYILAGGNSSNTKKGKEMMLKAVIGMLIIFGAGTVVRFIYTSFTKQAPGVTQCEQDYGNKGYSCQVIGGGKDELEARGCIAGKSGGDSLCRTAGQDDNVYCCPLDAPEPKTK